jgi:SpoVK/Ycf46/Vps4 family AAA+-type ATPase
VEITLPNKKGRKQILEIHTRKMRESGRLDPEIDFDELAELTKNFSGAEIEGLVRAAVSYALYSHVDATKVTLFVCFLSFFSWFFLLYHCFLVLLLRLALSESLLVHALDGLQRH